MREVSAQMEENPEGALSLLDSLDRSSLSDRDKATYDYLSAEAFYRNYFFLDDAHTDALSRAYQFKELERMRLSNLALLLVAILSTLVLYFWARKSQTQRLLLQEKAENERILSAAVFR